MKYILLIALSVVLKISHAQNSDSFSIIGTWQISEIGGTLSITFDSLGKMNMKLNDQVLMGDSFMAEGKLSTLNYNIDTSKNLNTITIELIELKTMKVTSTMYGIYAFKNENSLKLYLNLEDEKKPTQFYEPDTDVYSRVL